jgi:hypothetical protein
MAYSIIRQMHPDELPVIPFGDAQGVALTTEFFANQTARARESNARFLAQHHANTGEDFEADRLEAAIKAAEGRAGERAAFGGPVDVLVLRKGGQIRWIRRKKNCRAD